MESTQGAGAHWRVGRRIATAAIMAGNALLWLFPSNVAYLIAREKDVLLGRYSEGRFAGILLAAVVSWIALYLIRSRPDNLARRLLKVTALCLGILTGAVIVETAARTLRSPRYVRTGGVYHRPPGRVYTEVIRDAPHPLHSYPRLPPGYPALRVTLTVDAQGFRNRAVPAECDVLVIGDSFAEGSNVSDDGVWPVLYAARSRRSVYNLGMAGGTPATYVEALRQFGLKLSPEIVVCLIYEGNDFRDARLQEDERPPGDITPAQRLRMLYKTSPVRLALKRFMIGAFSFRSRVGKTEGGRNGGLEGGPGRDGNYALRWLPLAVPAGPRAKHYAFNIRKLLDHYDAKGDVGQSEGYRTVLRAIGEMGDLCRVNGARLVILFAPDASHVVMPAARGHLVPEQVRGFLSLKKEGLPPSGETMATLFSNMDCREELVRECCRREGIEFLSVTQRLRAAVEEGTQVYFTYDEHWTPDGHRIVAEELHLHLSARRRRGGRIASEARSSRRAGSDAGRHFSVFPPPGDLLP